MNKTKSNDITVLFFVFILVFGSLTFCFFSSCDDEPNANRREPESEYYVVLTPKNTSSDKSDDVFEDAMNILRTRKDFESRYTRFLQEKGFKVVGNMQVSTPATGVIYEFRLSYSLNGKKLGSSSADQTKFNKALGQNLGDNTGIRGQMQENILGEFITQNGARIEDYAEDFVRAYTVGATIIFYKQ